MKRWDRVIWAALASSTLAFACGDDEGGENAGGSGGSGGNAGSAGSAGSGGSGDASAGTGGEGGDGPSESGPHFILSATDYTEPTSKIQVFDVRAQTAARSYTYPDLDVALATTSFGATYALLRTRDELVPIGITGESGPAIALGPEADGGSSDAGAATWLNPSGVADLRRESDAGTGGQTRVAYVPFYNKGEIAVVDVTAGRVTKRIDMSGFNAESDADGSPDMAHPIYVSEQNRLYFVLSRVDLTTVVAPDYQLACEPQKSLLVALDTTTDELVDLNGAADGHGVELALTSATAAVRDGDRIVILNNGCTGAGGTQERRGIEAFSIGTGATSVLLEWSANQYLGALIRTAPGQVLVQALDDETRWYTVALDGPTAPQELSDVPEGLVFEVAGTLLGTRINAGDAGSTLELVRYDLAAKSASPLVSMPWQGETVTSSTLTPSGP